MLRQPWEPEAADLGLGVLALLDISQCYAPQLPTVGQYLEATIGTYRAVTMACQTKATSVAAKMDALVAGKATALWILKPVFPAYWDPDAAPG